MSHTEIFDSPDSEVWSILVDWSSIADWMPAGFIRSLEMEGAGPGSVRHITTSAGTLVSERLDAADEQRGRLELSILEPLPWDMISYQAYGQLDQIEPAKCRLHWEGCFELPHAGPAADALAHGLVKSYTAMFAGIQQRLAADNDE